MLDSFGHSMLPAEEAHFQQCRVVREPGRYRAVFWEQCQWMIAGSEHGLGHDVLLHLTDAITVPPPPLGLHDRLRNGDVVTISGTTGDVTITFLFPTSGTVHLAAVSPAAGSHE